MYECAEIDPFQFQREESLRDPRDIQERVDQIRDSLDVASCAVDLGELALVEVRALQPQAIDLELECVNCLERFRFPLEVQDFACQVELPGSEMVDLTGYLREDIVLALPPHPHCDWNGERVCKGAARLNEVHAAADSLADENEVWGALDQLKIKKT